MCVCVCGLYSISYPPQLDCPTFSTLSSHPIIAAPQDNSDYTLIVMYRSLNGNMLTLDGLQHMKETEQLVLNTPEYPKLCFAGNNSPDCDELAYDSLLEIYPDLSTASQQQLDNRSTEITSLMNTSAAAYFGREFARDDGIVSEFTR